MLFHLTEANARRSLRHVDEVIGVFTNISGGFRTVLERPAAERPAPAAA